jgi:hypothetical protein
MFLTEYFSSVCCLKRVGAKMRSTMIFPALVQPTRASSIAKHEVGTSGLGPWRAWRGTFNVQVWCEMGRDVWRTYYCRNRRRDVLLVLELFFSTASGT